MSSNATTSPLSPLTLTALRSVYRSRNLSRRKLAEAIGTTHPHTGRIMAGTSRPSKLLAARIGIALELPPEFISALIAESSDGGRKMRYGDKHPDTFPVGDTPCPIDACASNEFIIGAVRPHDLQAASTLEERSFVNAIGLLPAMGAIRVPLFGASVNPYAEFNAVNGATLAVWAGPPKPPSTLTAATAYEFIVSIPPASVLRCTHHDRQSSTTR